MITCKTYLTPSIPKEIFEIICNYIETTINVPVKLICETTSSGPKNGTMIDEDISFMCSPPFTWLYNNHKDKIELLEYAPVYDDPRNNNKPVYFSDVISNKINKLDELNNHIWGYNDTESLSGYFCMNKYMDKVKLYCTGGHLNSIKMIKNNKIDITCIDSNALLFINEKLNIIHTFGPHPIQPCVLNKKCKYIDDIKKCFENINNNIIIHKLNKYKIKSFSNIDLSFYIK